MMQLNNMHLLVGNIKMEFLYFMVNVVVIVLIGSFLFKLIERMFDNEV